MSLVGVVSDTHDHLQKVRAAVELFNRLAVEQVVHCGDIVAQFVLRELSALDAPLIVVFGNCDGDRVALTDRAAEFGFSIGDGPRRFELKGVSFVVSHQPLEHVPDCDWYLYGHTHRCEHRVNRRHIVNPGEACGVLTGRSTVAVVDTVVKTACFYDI